MLSSVKCVFCGSFSRATMAAGIGIFALFLVVSWRFLHLPHYSRSRKRPCESATRCVYHRPGLMELACFGAIAAQGFGTPRKPFASRSRSAMSTIRNASLTRISGASDQPEPRGGVSGTGCCSHGLGAVEKPKAREILVGPGAGPDRHGSRSPTSCPPRSSFGRASLTLRARPSTFVPSQSGSWPCTASPPCVPSRRKAKPRERPRIPVRYEVDTSSSRLSIRFEERAERLFSRTEIQVAYKKASSR